jgi:transcriptional regulator with XRE-family HTH domain
MDVASWVAKCRRERGWSLQYLSDEIARHGGKAFRESVWEWEQPGGGKISLRNMLALADVFELSDQERSELLGVKCRSDRREYVRAAIQRRGVTSSTMETAHRIVGKAIADGVLIRPTCCELCGEARDVDLHHPDYGLPLYVIPLCRSCHSYVHSGHRSEPRTGRVYRTRTRVSVSEPVASRAAISSRDLVEASRAAPKVPAVSSDAVGFNGPQAGLSSRLRDRFGLSVDDFAGLLGVSTSTVHRWERTGYDLSRIDPLQRNLLLLLENIDPVMASDFGNRIRNAILKGGTMRGLHVVLHYAYGSG